MDALPIHEENDVPYRSQHAGKMHACGHDCHTSILLGVAKRLVAEAKDLPGSVVLCFQPAEELGGPKGGAERVRFSASMARRRAVELIALESRGSRDSVEAPDVADLLLNEVLPSFLTGS